MKARHVSKAQPISKHWRKEEVSVSVPGRICLFGEHQDYLKLPVITAAIDLRVRITGAPVSEPRVTLHLPDIGDQKSFALPSQNTPIVYEEERDYYRSVINVLRRHDVQIDRGCECTVEGNIPINSGTSSSSALTVAWCRFLLEIQDHPTPANFLDPKVIARLAYLAEVEEFGEPGGMMDHYATVLGGILYQQFGDQVVTDRLPADPGSFVLGDSLEPKDTKGILGRVKQGVLDAVSMIREQDPEFDLGKVSAESLDRYSALLNQDQMDVLRGAVLNRNITQEALNLLRSARVDRGKIGRLLNRHQDVLRDQLRISTPKIDRMLNAAMDAGASGGKINGSGGGGCMFAYAPTDPEKAAGAIRKAGGRAYIVKIDEGLRIEGGPGGS